MEPRSPVGRNSRSVPFECEKLLFSYLVGVNRHIPFATFANNHVTLIGRCNSKERKASNNKKNRLRHLLLTDSGAFLDRLRTFDLEELSLSAEANLNELVEFHRARAKFNYKKGGNTPSTANDEADEIVSLDDNPNKAMTSRSNCTTASSVIEDPEFDLDYTLDLDSPFDNKETVIPLLSPRILVEGGTYSCAKLRITLPNVDTKDVELGYVSARIADSKHGVLLTKPSIPFSSYNRKEFEKKDNLCAAAKQTHLAEVVTPVEEDHNIVMKSTFFRFPIINGEQMLCNNKYFNPGTGDDMLRLVPILDNTIRAPENFLNSLDGGIDPSDNSVRIKYVFVAVTTDVVFDLCVCGTPRRVGKHAHRERSAAEKMQASLAGAVAKLNLGNGDETLSIMAHTLTDSLRLPVGEMIDEIPVEDNEERLEESESERSAPAFASLPRTMILDREQMKPSTGKRGGRAMMRDVLSQKKKASSEDSQQDEGEQKPTAPYPPVPIYQEDIKLSSTSEASAASIAPNPKHVGPSPAKKKSEKIQKWGHRFGNQFRGLMSSKKTTVEGPSIEDYLANRRLLESDLDGYSSSDVEI